MKPTPKKITAKGGMLEILWSDDHQSRYVVRDVRLGCRCAACVDEWTHETLVRSDTVPMDLKVKGIETVGHYALHFTWSDGHNTGLFTYDYLRELCGCEDCKKPRSFTV